MDLTSGVLIAWDIAAAEASAGRAAEISPGHLVIGLSKLCDGDLERLRDRLRDPGADDRSVLAADAAELRAAFVRMGVDPVALRRRVRTLAAAPRDRTRRYEEDDGVVHRDRMSRRAFRRATEIAGMSAGGSPRGGRVRALHLLQALLEMPDEAVTRALVELAERASPGAGAGPDGPPRGGGTPTLDRFGRDLTALARAGRLPPLIGRREELRTVARALVRHRTNSVILVGDAGVGKTGVVEGLAALAASADAPEPLAGLRFVELPVGALVAGTKYRGELEERVEAVVNEVAADPTVVLFVDEIHQIAGTGRGSTAQVGQLLKPALARGEIRCIGATTTDEYQRHIEADRALQRRFQLVVINEPTRPEALEILKALRNPLAEHFGVEITDDALAAAVDLTHRYLPHLRLPDKAIQVVDEACAGARIVTLTPGAGRAPDRVGREEIAAVVAGRARVPVERLTRDEAQRLLGMEAALGARIVGQRAAVRAVCDVVRAARTGLADPRRPAGVLLFAGPTGTGKTELAKALAEFLFGDEDRLIRIDMSEYKERHSVARLVGSPPGYIGYGDEGQLTGPVRADPYRVVLLDEVEKAHAEVLDLLLQLLGDGRLTDGRGRRASFTECVIVLTTNLGSDEADRRKLGFAAGDDPVEHGAERRQRVIEAVRARLRPELIGRIGDPIVFDPLTAEDLARILERLLAGVRDRVAEQGVALTVDTTAAELIVHRGSDPSRGARELERAVEQLVTVPVAAALLEGRARSGDEVVVEGRDGAIVLRITRPEQRSAPRGPLR